MFIPLFLVFYLFFAGYCIKHFGLKRTPPINYPTAYCVNFMWINRNINVHQQYIFPDNIYETYFNTVKTAALKNPETIIFIWYDGNLLSKEAMLNTQHSIDKIIDESKIQAQIKLKDIRALQKVKNHPEVFSASIPVYFRVDLLRELILMKLTLKNRNLHCVYYDLDAEIEGKEILFNHKTQKKLDAYSFVMVHEKNKLGFENSFQICVYDEQLIRAKEKMLIEANIIRAYTFLKEAEERKNPNNFFSRESVWKVHSIAFQGNVFYSYPLMFTYFLQLRNQYALILPHETKPYNESDNIEILNENAKIIMSQSSVLECLEQFPMPTKKINIPPTKSALNELNR